MDREVKGKPTKARQQHKPAVVGRGECLGRACLCRPERTVQLWFCFSRDCITARTGDCLHCAPLMATAQINSLLDISICRHPRSQARTAHSSIHCSTGHDSHSLLRHTIPTLHHCLAGDIARIPTVAVGVAMAQHSTFPANGIDSKVPAE